MDPAGHRGSAEGARDVPVAGSCRAGPGCAENAWEKVVRRLEGEGFAVEPAAPRLPVRRDEGCRAADGGVEPASSGRSPPSGPGWDARCTGAAERKFAALAAAGVARPGQVLVVAGKETLAFLAPLPLSLLPLDEARYAEIEGLGMRRIGELASLPGRGA